jgi:hypothetical protein
VVCRELDVSEKPVVSGSKNNASEILAEAGVFLLGSIFNPEPGGNVNFISQSVEHSII